MNQNEAVGYVRLSDKKDGSSSIPSQKKRIIEYCERYNLNLLQIFEDDGKSGWTFERPGFRELEAFCKQQKQIKYLIIPHFDRFSRADPIDAMVKERHFRDKLNVKVLQVSEPPDTDTTNSTYQIVRFMQAYVANEERSRIVERVINGIRYNKLQGRYCTTAPYGYTNTRQNDKGIIVVDESKAEIVKFIFRQYLAGFPIEQVKKQAIAKGFNQKGKSAITKILSTATYAGLIKIPAYKQQPEKMVKGIHEPLITELQYWTVQQRLVKRDFISNKREEVPLRGYLLCHHCGKLMTAAPSKSGSGKYYWYYFCNDHKKENLSATKIHDQLNRIFEAISIKRDVLDDLRDKLTTTLDSHISSQTKELMKAELLVSKAEKTIADIEERYLLQPVSQDTYKRVMTEKQSYLNDLIAKRDALKVGAVDYMRRLETALQKASSLQFVYQTLDITGKQWFLKKIFGTTLSYSLGTYRTQFLHPAFLLKPASLKGLPMIVENKTPSKNGVKVESDLQGSSTELDFEFFESFITIFAA